VKTLCQRAADGTCSQCGEPIASGHYRQCSAGTFARPYSRPKLGDQVESAFNALGITEERYKATKELFGLPPTCGCADRKEWLNKVSDWWRGQ